MRRWVNAAGLAAALSGALVVAACGSDTNQRTDERYCAAVQQHLAELNTPSIATPADITRTVELYRTIAATAPLSVEQEWNVLAIAYETASTVEPGDQASMQKAADTIRASQKSATAVDGASGSVVVVPDSNVVATIDGPIWALHRRCGWRRHLVGGAADDRHALTITARRGTVRRRSDRAAR